MIAESEYILYALYGCMSISIAVAYIKISYTESVTITTKEFVKFQSNFLIGYMIIMIGELLSMASFYAAVSDDII